MPTRRVVLTDHQQETIERLVQSGRFQNASEVLGEGLRLIERQEEHDAAKLGALQKAAQHGFDDLDEGRFVDIPSEELGTYVARLGLSPQERMKRSSG
ncbi:type II toxin-antitoxin system ParD family antitoxin [Rhizobium sp. SSA_523]|uniref:type II toxin-antitoxin system ParD family antitoxin n=1 Tax=Rhizobium sp. SSA_523 TaxID=2952477 RepID=UPI0020902A02|nr:type II toxin-antitoxin system ParD family antitoxin [Rhizobium sp. SSA_523]MCO5731790.1 type II toxin-antitoxin system ParD family antitoxin [Rhizobium sp. SSA_523]WKC22841.1 type II toxin-antitoxin system ParD family antitoxin [Rhizobium sp. SSA_523]